MKYCVLDLETTGFDEKKDSIIEISFIIFDEFSRKKIAQYDNLFLPTKNQLNDFVSHLTGISSAMLEKKAKNLSSEWQIIQKLLTDAIIIGHNIDFDLKFLSANGIDVSRNKRVDTHELSRILLPQEESYSLEILAQKYQFSHKNAHRAMSDVIANSELLWFLLDKMKAQPQQFFREISEVITTKTDWFARRFFMNQDGSSEEKNKNAVCNLEKKTKPVVEKNKAQNTKDLQQKKRVFFRQFDNKSSTKFQHKLVRDFSSKEKKVLFVTPKMQFFPELRQFPTPSVLLSSEKLSNFVSSRRKLTSDETVFFLQCKNRQVRGLRGVDFFDLFLQQRDLWQEVCMQKDDQNYREVLKEKSREKILMTTPAAFLAFVDNDIFADRIVVIDEAEIFAEKLLSFPTKTFSVFKYLNSAQDKISTAAQFFIANFCKDILEKELGHEIGPFPETIVFNEEIDLSKIADEYCSFASTEDRKQMMDFVSRSLTGDLLQYCTYFPRSGNLSFFQWRVSDWQSLKQKFGSFPLVIFHRQSDDCQKFFARFLGVSAEKTKSLKNNYQNISLTIPSDLISIKSPDFTNFTVAKVLQNIKETPQGSSLAINFSSLKSLEDVFTQVSKNSDLNQTELLAEKIMGGEGKLIKKITDREGFALFYQRFAQPQMWQKSFQKVVFQKFPFSSPSIILQQAAEFRDENTFKLWGIPQVKANLSRRMADFPELREVVFLDSRENSSWGKEILASVFGG